MWGKRIAVSFGILAMVLMVAAGCGRPAAQKKNPATDVAVAFYRAYWLGTDYEEAWDMALPGAFAETEHSSKEAFVARQRELDARIGKQPDTSRQVSVEEHQRVEDFLYMVSDSQTQMLIWVTNTPQGWKVRKYQLYKGGPIPWSSASSQRYS